MTDLKPIREALEFYCTQNRSQKAIDALNYLAAIQNQPTDRVDDDTLVGLMREAFYETKRQGETRERVCFLNALNIVRPYLGESQPTDRVVSIPDAVKAIKAHPLRAGGIIDLDEAAECCAEAWGLKWTN